MPYNTDLLINVRETIRMRPEQHDQAAWMSESENPIDSCGTVCCIAGWAVALSGQWGLINRVAVESLARDALGLSEQETVSLFYTMDEDIALAYLDEIIEKAKRQ